MTVLALAKLGHQYFLWGGGAVVCLITFVLLILSPALSSYGRIWEKAAAGFLAAFVLAALVLSGIVIGLIFVYYYPDINNYLHGN